MQNTALMPLNPAVSPQQVARILPIRANLLPREIIAGRRARQMRVFVILAAVIVVAGIGAWYADAYQDEKQAIRERDAVSAQVDQARAAQNTVAYREVTTVIQANKTYQTQLKALMTDDLPWSTVLDDLRSTGAAKQVTVGSITATIADKLSSGVGSQASSGATGAVVTLVISGTAKDKKTIAGFMTALTTVHGVANPYLTTAAQDKDKVSFTINADVTSAALCGRFSTTKCTTGGN